MHRLPRLALVIVALAAVVLALPASPASAQSRSGSDAHGDVLLHTQDQDGDDVSTPTERPEIDLVGYRIRYTATRISAVLRYRELERTGPPRFFAGLLMQYPTGYRDTGYADLTVTSTPRNRAGRSVLNVLGRDSSSGGGPGAGAADRVAGCVPRHRIDYRRNRVVVSVPASCFGSPRYVDAFVGTYQSNRGETRTWVDAAPGDHQGEDGSDDRTVRVRRG